jgi:NADH-quinone oxidoreductase subunit N
VKYFVTGAVSSSFFLIGSSILYGVTGSIQFLNLYAFYMNLLLFDVSDNLVDSFPEVGLTFILFSIFIKLSVAPFHLWSLDVYEGSPTNSTIFFAVISKLSLFVLIIRFCYGSLKEFVDCWEFYTVTIGVFSIFVGSFGGLKQRKLRTLKQYSSTSHIGYCLLALVANYIGLTSLFFYMTVYMISGLSIWSILLALRLKENFSSNKYNKELGSLSLLRKSNSPLTFVLVLTIFSLAGTPPLLGFLAKIFLFLPVVGFTYYSVVLISLLISVVSTFYYIRVVKVLYFENVLKGAVEGSYS